MNEHKPVQDPGEEFRDVVERLSHARLVTPDPKLLKNVLAALPKSMPSGGVVEEEKRNGGVPSPYRGEYSFVSQIMNWKVLVPSALVILFAVTVGLDLAKQNIPISAPSSEYAPQAMMMSEPVGEAVPSLIMVTEPATGGSADTRMMAPSAKLLTAHKDIRFSCDGKTIFMRLPDPELAGSAGDLTLDTGETLTLILAGGASELRRVYTNDLGDELILQKDKDLPGKTTATFLRNGITLYRTCHEENVVE